MNALYDLRRYMAARHHTPHVASLSADRSRLLAHVSRIRQLDASRRATAIAKHNAAQQRDRHHEPTADRLIRAARQAANEPLVTSPTTSLPLAPVSPYEAIGIAGENLLKGNYVRIANGLVHHWRPAA